MHREIQIKQFPIVLHIDGLRHETSGLCEKTNSIYIVFYLLYTTMSKWSECAHVFAWGDLIGWRLRWRLKSWNVFNFCREQRQWSDATDPQFSSATLDVTPFKVNERRWRRRPCEWGVTLRKRRKWSLACIRHSLPERTHTHVTHRMHVRTQITWTWLCTRGKKRYKYCSFSHTNRSFRVLGHQCVVTMGNCLIWISLCMFFFPLIETVTYTCHYMTDRLERFDLKTSKLDLLKKKRHLHLGCPWGKLIDTKF